METYKINFAGKEHVVTEKTAVQKIEELAQWANSRFDFKERSMGELSNFFKSNPLTVWNPVHHESSLVTWLTENNTGYGVPLRQNSFEAIFMAVLAFKLDRDRFKAFFIAIQETQTALQRITL